MKPPPFKIKWRSRFDSLAPLAVIGLDAAAVRLKDKLLLLDDEHLSALRGVFAETLLFVTGEAEKLPWADGVSYLGKDALAPSIFLPTTMRPDLPLDLFEKILLHRFAPQRPFAVVGELIVPVGPMLPISRRILSEIL